MVCEYMIIRLAGLEGKGVFKLATLQNQGSSEGICVCVCLLMYPAPLAHS
jgi:hypothetical protein